VQSYQVAKAEYLLQCQNGAVKSCSICHQDKPLTEFHIKRSCCKSCLRNQYREIHKQNQSKICSRKRANYRRKRTHYLSKISARRKRYYLTNHNYYLSCRLRSRLTDALKNTGHRKVSGTMILLGCSLPQFKAYLESKFLAGMSWDNRKDWHIDHVKPCSSFDLSRPDEQRKCFHFSNMQPLWAKDNLHKSNRII
jgi:hypothetical protein